VLSRQFGYPCRIVNRVCKVRSPFPCFSAWSSPRDAPLPSFGSQRAWFPARQWYYEGATTSHLRISGHLFCSLPLPTRSSCFVSAEALLEGRRSPPGPGLGCRLPVFPAVACGRQWDLSGLQAIPPVPLLRSSTPVEPMCPCHGGHFDAAPATHTAKASDDS